MIASGEWWEYSESLGTEDLSVHGEPYVLSVLKWEAMLKISGDIRADLVLKSVVQSSDELV